VGIFGDPFFMLFGSFVMPISSWQQKALVGRARRARQRFTSSAKIEKPPTLPLGCGFAALGLCGSINDNETEFRRKEAFPKRFANFGNERVKSIPTR
jgi:hypothetical protein